MKHWVLCTLLAFAGSTSAGDGGGSGLRCPGDQVVCGPGGVDPLMCPPGTFCVTGCCIPSIG